MDGQGLEEVVVVLVEPQDDINIGTALRAMRNFGVSTLRLVRPASADPGKICISAPRCEDVVGDIERYQDLDAALEDCVLTLGMTARRRSATWKVLEPRQAARTVLRETAPGRVAILFGREDSGLDNACLDRCHAMVTVPTNPDYSSLNLGQAVTLLMWELSREAQGIEEGQGLEKHEAESEFDKAAMGGVERMFERAEAALEAIEFFKSDGREHIMRSVRSVFLRARLDTRELAIWHGIFKEVMAYMERQGIGGMAPDLGDQSSETKQ